MKRLHRFLALIVVTLVNILIFQEYSNLISNHFERLKTEQSLYDEVLGNDTKTILYWTPMFNVLDFYIGVGSKPFKNCKYSNCYATYQKNRIAVEKFDAIIFHGYQFTKAYYGLPQKRSIKQVYIFANKESPEKEIDMTRSFYNWTMTYRYDSDVPWTYGSFVAKPTNYILPKLEDIRRKRKMVVGFISNCNTTSHRELIIPELSKYVPVDIYGKCGHLTCPKTKMYECYKNVEKNYKFYLAFENSICEDYVTEKMYNWLNLDLIPVVYGGANYTKLAPPKSVINLLDFKSLPDLANYLTYLDLHPEEYLKYFEWKKHYVISKNEGVCDLCQKLHENRKTQTYTDLGKWWFGYNTPKCLDLNVTELF